MLEPYINKMPERLAEFNPFPSVADREAWDGLQGDIKECIIARGDEALDAGFPYITASDWLSYSRNGDRAGFEAKYFARRRGLCALVLAECAQAGGRYTEAIINHIFAICEESGWQLPAHNTYIRDTPALPLPDVSRPVLDLFACETGALLACAVYLLKEPLTERCPALLERVDCEIERRVAHPYLNGWFWWMGDGNTNNWTVWCTQNVLYALFLGGSPLAKDACVKAAASIDAFLDGYAEDGCCDEGAMYYRHAGLCLFGALEALDTVSGGVFAPLWRVPKIRNIARYILDVHVDGDYYINLGDCSPKAGRAGAREFLFAKRIGDSELSAFAAADYIGGKGWDLPDEINLFYRTQAVFAARTIRALPITDMRRRDAWYPDSELYIARDGTYCLAVNAGSNGVGHNHNDAGSFILYKNGKPFIIDIGVETYTAKTFSPERYKIWTMRSSWHNLPDFDGIEQQAGDAFRARDVRASLGYISSCEMELAGAWPETARIRSYKRRVTLVKGVCVKVSDMYDGGFASVTLNLMFSVRPVIEEWGLELPGLGKLRLTGASNITIEEVGITDPKLRQAWPECIYRARIVCGKAIEIDIT
ncbi:MAG: heparinase II/III-family protein [Clostridiales bacterium]|nr:heparinase II/III-family protein [Clostridiales bacterium]